MAGTFDIIIPSWNNLPYLKLCVESIRKNSHFDHHIIIHANGGTDGTIQWLEEEGIEFTRSEENIGICRAFNRAMEKAQSGRVLYLNDDMYVLPGWDRALIQRIPDAKQWMISATMIEARETGNPVVIHADFGSSPRSFREEELLASADALKCPDWSGSTWPPVLMPRNLLESVGGFSEEFSPGMYSDPDLAMKFWKQGNRYFLGVGDSLVYHFQARSTGRVLKNNGRLTFMKKWGITASAFYKYHLRMGERANLPLETPAAIKLLPNRLRVKFKTAFS